MSNVLISRDKAEGNLRNYASIMMNAGNLVAAGYYRTAADRIAVMEGIECWIPVAEVEPPEGLYVIGWRDGDWDKTRIFDHDIDGEAFWSGHVFAKNPPTHWMMCPEEPEV